MEKGPRETPGERLSWALATVLFTLARTRGDISSQAGLSITMKSPLISRVWPADRLQKVVLELRQQAPSWASRLSHASSDDDLLEILGEVYDLTHALSQSGPIPSPTSELHARIRAFICANLHRGVQLRQLAQHLGYSEKHCSDLFRSVMGQSFTIYLKGERLQKAQELLSTTDRSLEQIAYLLGFSDQFSFSHFFKRAAGQAPLHFRRQHAKPSR